jgi:2-hydroxy-3-keto-5-methylthiopentenyl-1-phosphate phosphatase
MTITPDHKRMVFCDFDGTITVRETLVAMLRRYAPDKMEEFAKKIAGGKITLREGVRGVVESIPSHRYGDVVEFIRDQDIRPGFSALLDFLKDRGVPFVVISGGLVDSVKTRLAPYVDDIHGIYAAGIDNSGEYLKVVSEFEENDELVAKVRVMSLYRYEYAVAIGDGATDQKMALNASVVFARGLLARFLDKAGRPYVSWEDFFNIRDYLQDLWKEEII